MTQTIRVKEAFIETSAGVTALPAATVTIEGGRITEAGASASPPTLDLSPYRLLPGLIDIHVHGGDGVDVMDATVGALEQLGRHKLREGVTSYCPTTMTAPLDDIQAALTAVKTAKAAQSEPGWHKSHPGAKIIGAFLEGPYIDPAYKGAHPEDLIRGVSVDELRELLSIGAGCVNSVAIAPNLRGALKAIAFLREQGVHTRIGHSNATVDEAGEAVATGAALAIHTYNAMRPLNHREPGMVGAALTNPDLYAELICDLVHVHPAAMRLLVNARGPGKVVLVTDCMMAGGLADGDYTLGGLPVIVKHSQARLHDGTLAGSMLNLMTAVKNMHETVGVPLASAVEMASLTPATALGLSDIGGIKPGKRADLVAIDNAFNPVVVIMDGEIVLDNR